MLTILFSLGMLVWTIFLLDGLIGLRKIDPLEKEEGMELGPLLSVVVAARNEEKQIEASILSQLEQTYKNVEWILVNDRSTDMTGTIMEELTKIDPRLKVLHVNQLPEGWLGKNNALYTGALQASGKWLLFTDADVKFEKQAFAKALHYFERHKLDHLTAAPNLSANRFWLKSFVAFFLFGFSYFKRPWLANNPKSKIGTGIGAFILVLKKSYESFGTHEKIKMRPDDDLQLGMKMKKAGYRQRIVTALHLIEVEWYGSLKEALVGLEKNTFAGLHYRISMVIFAILGVFITNVLPFVMIFSGNTTVALLSFGNIVLCGILYVVVIKKLTLFSPMMFLVFPITALLFIYSIIRASLLTFKRGGIVWRGTTYRLSELREKD
ncbi:Glycosyltransferase, catalytic subunit of cellulose synthase and poly-beta-1,6-N-acetylglucosamine synthase [Bacillus sp. OV166]|uniref:glycosyltransferase n=1 Tax=Bacillaceae TaxID=186817 RepID=UPI000A2AE3E4|nr:glycosyltransferase family 2 protein [Bacillus sp. OV166]SMQ82668.1 Glycosyltransferase, catalytic subunit of cellulose synthase and poly-beta-1,6-N-acetylglucosamine synthase [Bacillus sp. OV166]